MGSFSDTFLILQILHNFDNSNLILLYVHYYLDI